MGMTAEKTELPRLKQGETLVIASHNDGKVREFSMLLAQFGLNIIGASSLGLEEPNETGQSFAENALLKALKAARASEHFALGDDSGLEVEALDGAPGLYSARWAEGGQAVSQRADGQRADGRRDFASAMRRIHREMQQAESASKKACFVCALACCSPDGRFSEAEGRVHGQIVWPPRGRNGFGYDPIFVPDGEIRSFAEMTAEEKSLIDHRARAFSALARKILPAETP